MLRGSKHGVYATERERRVGGAGGTLVLTGFREVVAAAGLVGVTAPEQVIARLEELGLLGDTSTETRRAPTMVAHLTYGAGIGAALGFLRRERGGVAEETAVGATLGLLARGRTGAFCCLPPVSTSRRGKNKPRRCSCRSSTMPFTLPLGGFCTGL